MKVSKVVLLAAAMLFACAGSAVGRTVLQAPQQPMPAAGQGLPPASEATAPPQCQKNWEAEKIQCSFTCPTGDWELICETSAPNVASCHVKRQEGPKEESVYFLCLTAPQAAPNCQNGLNALNVLPDPCVVQNTQQISSQWAAVPPQE
jgi:hypothetical protein